MKTKNEQRQWHHIDAENAVVGRIARDAAVLLRGKQKPTFAPHIDGGDFVVITNCEKAVFTGAKEEQKEYWRYSGYPGGIRSKSVAKLRTEEPEEILRHAVKHMLPDNKLQKGMLKRLKLVVGSENPFAQHFSSK